jgi:hypothetical protein
MHPSRADIRYWQGVAHNRNTSSSAAFRAGIRLAHTEGYKRGLTEAVNVCKNLAALYRSAYKGPGEPFATPLLEEAAKVIEALKGEKSETR